MMASDTESQAEWKEIEVGEKDAGMRLDQWLAAAFAPDLSRNRIQALIQTGSVKHAGMPITERRQKVKAGEVYHFLVPQITVEELKGENIPLSILFEDDELIVIDKPAGLVVHPAPGNNTGTLVNALLHHCAGKLSMRGGADRPGIVHRIDRDTSGVIVAAKTDRAHEALASAFASHGRDGELERGYVALVWGAPARMNGTIDAPLGRSHADRILRMVVPENRADARNAVTHYTILERFGADIGKEITASLLECRLETGRTHQIRVHLAHIGHPVIGDQAYGRAFLTKANRLPPILSEAVKGFSRQALHAKFLAFRHPATGEYLRFEASVPDDMAELLQGFRHLDANRM